MRTRVFRHPKCESYPDDYEDACAVSRGWMAIADGATESSFAVQWATLLVESFVRERPVRALADSEGFLAWAARLRENWHDQIDWNDLPWYAVDKARAGAFAAFLGVRVNRRALSRARAACWSAVAIGDCCLVQARGTSIVVAFPMTQACEFGSRPVLLSSRASDGVSPNGHIRFAHGVLRRGDRLLLMTDAIAHWFLSSQEAGQTPMAVLDGSNNLAATVRELRNSGQLHRDDTTLIQVIRKGGGQ